MLIVLINQFKSMSKKSKKVVTDDINTPNLEIKQNCITFWRPSDPNNYLGQWYKADFEITNDICENFPNEIKTLSLYMERYDVLQKLANDQTQFNTAEKFMMMAKAALFLDNVAFNRMADSENPAEHKQLGRTVKRFNENVWDKYNCDIVKIGNYLKFTQNNDLKIKLLSTKGYTLVEGSPLDKVWGIGLKFDDPKCQDKSNWKGKNYLGECLMLVRNII